MEQPAQNTLVVEEREGRGSRLYASNKLASHITRHTYMNVHTYVCVFTSEVYKQSDYLCKLLLSQVERKVATGEKELGLR